MLLVVVRMPQLGGADVHQTCGSKTDASWSNAAARGLPSPTPLCPGPLRWEVEVGAEDTVAIGTERPASLRRAAALGETKRRARSSTERLDSGQMRKEPISEVPPGGGAPTSVPCVCLHTFLLSGAPPPSHRSYQPLFRAGGGPHPISPKPARLPGEQIKP